MKVYDITFSPTGGTKKVSQIISHALSEEIVSIDLLDFNVGQRECQLTHEDCAVISVPSFGGRAPQTAIERLLSIKGNGARAIVVCVYGNREYEDTLVELQDAVTHAGFQVIAGIAALAQHSMVNEIAAGRPDEKDRVQLLTFVSKIKEKLNQDTHDAIEILGQRPYKTRHVIPVIPLCDDVCCLCGICAQNCPVQAIDLHNPKIVNDKLCISCMRCIAVCPIKARHVDDETYHKVSSMLQKVALKRKENTLFL